MTQSANLDTALRNAGMTEEEAQVLVQSPKLLRSVIAGVRKTIPVEPPSPTSALELLARTRVNRLSQAMAYFDIKTDNDLQLLRALDLLEFRYVGHKTVQTIHLAMMEFGFTLFEDISRPLERAVEITGDVNLVPLRLMRLWATEIDSQTQHYFRVGTLGELSKMSRGEFTAKRRLSHHSLMKTPSGPSDEAQADAVSRGLAHAGFKFLGE